MKFDEQVSRSTRSDQTIKSGDNANQNSGTDHLSDPSKSSHHLVPDSKQAFADLKRKTGETRSVNENVGRAIVEVIEEAVLPQPGGAAADAFIDKTTSMFGDTTYYLASNIVEKSPRVIEAAKSSKFGPVIGGLYESTAIKLQNFGSGLVNVVMDAADTQNGKIYDQIYAGIKSGLTWADQLGFKEGKHISDKGLATALKEDARKIHAKELGAGAAVMSTMIAWPPELKLFGKLPGAIEAVKAAKLTKDAESMGKEVTIVAGSLQEAKKLNIEALKGETKIPPRPHGERVDVFHDYDETGMNIEKKPEATVERQTFKTRNDLINDAKKYILRAKANHPELGRASSWLNDATVDLNGYSQGMGTQHLTDAFDYMRRSLEVLRPYKNVSKDAERAFQSIESSLEMDGATKEQIKANAERTEQTRVIAEQETKKVMAECAERAKAAQSRAAEAEIRIAEALEWVKRGPRTIEHQSGPILKESLEATTYNPEVINKTTTMRDGTVIKDDQNGYREVEYKDGTTVCEEPDGRRVTHKPNSSKIDEGADGSLTIETADCRVTQTEPNGSIHKWIDYESMPGLSESEYNHHYLRMNYPEGLSSD